MTISFNHLHETRQNWFNDRGITSAFAVSCDGFKQKISSRYLYKDALTPTAHTVTSQFGKCYGPTFHIERDTRNDNTAVIRAFFLTWRSDGVKYRSTL